MDTTKTRGEIPCIGCGAMVPDTDGPTHRYMGSSPGCWEAFGVLLAMEYESAGYWRSHQLTVDAWAVQHPGVESPRTLQSVAVHLFGLYLQLEGEPMKSEKLAAARRWMVERYKAGELGRIWKEPGAYMGELNVLHMFETSTPEEYARAAREWAQSAWDAYAEYHELVRSWKNT
jgi:hypothetical protein